MLRKVRADAKDERIIQNEIAYLLHIRRVGLQYQRETNSSIERYLKELMGNYAGYEFNPKVLVVLIETGYIQECLSVNNKSDYPKFLITILRETDKSFLKEACCRRIIKFFGKDDKGRDGDEPDGKIEFINLVEPLAALMSRPAENGVRLTALSLMAIVNMCNFSEDIKDIFLQKNGFLIIVDLLNSKDEEILVNCLRLIMTLIAANKSGELNQLGRVFADNSNNLIIRRLIQLIKEGPAINFCQFSKQVTYMSITLLRSFI